MRNLKMKLASILFLVAVLTLELSPLANLNAISSQLQFYSTPAVSVGYDAVNGKNVFYGRSTLGGKTAYCIDYSCGLPSGTMKFRDRLSDQGMAILVYGFPNSSASSMGCETDEEAYMATQMALWEVLNRTGESHKSGLIFRVENVTVKAGKEDFMRRATAAAKKLVARAENDPYTQSPKLVVDTSGANLTYIGDDALMGPYIATTSGGVVKSLTASLIGAPSSARITDASGNTKTAVASGESVYIRMSSTEATTEFKINFKTDIDRRIGLIYSSTGTTQDYAILDTEPVEIEQPITVKWTQTEGRGRIELVKVDQDNQPVVGAKFKLENMKGESLGEVSTGTDGKVIFLNVPAGNYKLIELEAPTGYIIKSQSTNVTVVAGETTNVTVTNERITGKLVITKVDDANRPIENVTFEIYDSEGYLYKTIVTDAQGKATVNLDYGKYFFKEVKAPAGYIMDDTLYTFTVDAENRTFLKTVENERYKGSVVIVKTDDDNTPIMGVKFNIYNEEGKLINTITTNDKGLAGLTNLPLGKYYYQEVEAPNNVVMDGERHEFKLETRDQVLRIDVINKLIKGQLKIIKVDGENNPIANVKFNILDSNRKVIETITTNKDGIAVSSKLVKGSYYYQEIEAPDDVVMDTRVYPFNITTQNQVIEKKVVNEKMSGSLKVVKYDETGKLLSGVTFNILDANKKIVDTITTDENGEAVSIALKLGEYYYQEISAPAGIVIDNEMYRFAISFSQQVVRKTIVNELAKGTLKIVKVDEGSAPIKGVKFNILDKDKNVVDTITTDENGIAISKKLGLGEYYYQEIEVPSMYQLDSKEYPFVLTYNNQQVTKTVVNEYQKGILKIIKVDENNEPLAGVKFKIMDENYKLVEIIETNSNGIAASSNMKKGTYYFQEIEAPEGIIVDDTIYKFTIEYDGQNVIKNMVNNYAKGKLEILKVDTKQRPIEGVKFNILDADKKVVDTIITDKDGKATTKNLVLGTYYYQEIEAPSNVVIDEEMHTFVLRENNQIIKKTIINDLLENKLKIIKVDENNEPLAGVTFNILDKENNIIDTMVTDENGIAISKEIDKGTYYYQEISAPEGIVIDSNIYEFTVEYDGQNVIKNIVNNYIKGSLKIVKVDSNGNYLAGVKFNILDADKRVIDTITTDENGEAQTITLKFGTYYYQEIEAPENVIIDDGQYKFEIKTDKEIIVKKVTNEIKKGDLKIIKVDENNEPLAGVSFDILDMDKKVIDTMTTDENGIAVSKGMEKGTYYYQEVSAPEGIVIDNNLYEFTIEYDGQNVIKNIVNNYVKGSLVIEKVDSNGNYLPGVKFNILDKDKKVIATIITSRQGVTEPLTLKFGTYYYQEIEAPENVIMDTNMYEFEITTDKEIVVKKVINEVKKGDLKIIKVDENNEPLAGVTFDILDMDKKVIDTIVTDENGIAVSKNIAKGTYYYQEVAAPEGIIIDNNLYEFTVEYDGQNVIENMVNYYVKGQLKIVKVDTNQTPIAGVKFNILDADKKVVDTITTDENGIAMSKKLGYGEYYYQEIEAPSKYQVDSNMYKFAINDNNQVIQKTVVNKEKPGTLKLIKVDENNNPIAGVKFELLDSNEVVLGTYTTDSKGEIKVENMTVGKYYVKEVFAPEMYELDGTLIEIEIKAEEVTEIVIENKFVTGTLEMYKYNQYKEPIANVEFTIYDEDGKVIDVVITDENGIAISKSLKLGKYYYQETKAPSGYIIDNNKYEFSVSVENKVVKAIVFNERVEGFLKIVKIDAKTKQPLAGAKFQLLNENKEVIKQGISNESGIIVFDNLEKGKYYYQEIEAPTGYELNNKVYEFSIGKDGQVIERVVENSLIELPVTGGNISLDNMIIMTITIASVVIYGLKIVLEDKKKFE